MPGRRNRKCESPEQARAGLNRIVGGGRLEWSGQGLYSGGRADQVSRSHSAKPPEGFEFFSQVCWEAVGVRCGGVARSAFGFNVPAVVTILRKDRMQARGRRWGATRRQWGDMKVLGQGWLWK